MSEHPTLRQANVHRQIEWDRNNQITLAYRGNELAGEVGEACNIIKKLERERLGIKGSRATVEQLAEELADVVICADLIAMHTGIDLEEAIVAKFNATSKKVGLKTRMSPPPIRCVACGEPLRDGDSVYTDVNGGVLHAACCGPEREGYVNGDGEPLKDGEPIPAPYNFRARDFR